MQKDIKDGFNSLALCVCVCVCVCVFNQTNSKITSVNLGGEYMGVYYINLYTLHSKNN